MDKPKVSPKDFFLWAGAMITLYVSVFSFIQLMFDYINYGFPDPLQYYPSDPYSGSVSYEMASLIVLFPIFFILMRIVHQDILRDPTRRDIWVRRWALYLTLFVAAATLAGDLITLLMYFFNGDLTTRFLAKVFLVCMVAGGGFLHFLADLKGYWEKFPRKALSVGISTTFLIVATIGAGFFIIGTPWQARLYRFDDQKINDLQTIQYQVVNYWQQKSALPPSLTDLNDPISGQVVPVDPQTQTPYTYKIIGQYSFQICAVFNAETSPRSATISARSAPVMVPIGVGSKIAGVENWYHMSGSFCFARGIDPERHPPFPKQKTQ